MLFVFGVFRLSTATKLWPRCIVASLHCLVALLGASMLLFSCGGAAWITCITLFGGAPSLAAAHSPAPTNPIGFPAIARPAAFADGGLITFVIPTTGRNTLRRTLVSLLQQQHPGWRALVLFDGNGYHLPEDAREVAEDPRIAVMALPIRLGREWKHGHGESGSVRNEAFRHVCADGFESPSLRSGVRCHHHLS